MTSRGDTQWFDMRPIAPSLASRLAPPRMVTQNADLEGTAYRITIDSSASSITTGISAEDRAQACHTISSPHARVDSFRRSGHFVLLTAWPGGVCKRMGHIKAAVDVCQLARKAPVGIIAELVGDGEFVEGVTEVGGNNGMMRRDGCLKLVKRWGIKICTIEDLVIYLDRAGVVIN